ncbi:hypothetical protein TNCV_2982401 [Trichonephila clavipes]|nr:hypothetical protein TNCV_2982401 [Trichonephila clavipes]
MLPFQPFGSFSRRRLTKSGGCVRAFGEEPTPLPRCSILDKLRKISQIHDGHLHNGVHHNRGKEIADRLAKEVSENETATGTSPTYLEPYFNDGVSHLRINGTEEHQLVLLEIKCDRGSQTALIFDGQQPSGANLMHAKLFEDKKQLLFYKFAMFLRFSRSISIKSG